MNVLEYLVVLCIHTIYLAATNLLIREDEDEEEEEDDVDEAYEDGAAGGSRIERRLNLPLSLLLASSSDEGCFAFALLSACLQVASPLPALPESDALSLAIMPI